jgi:hypothetical protein
MIQPYYCKDCGRSFFNLGWHAEVCGSSNYEPMADYWERLDELRKEKKRLEAGQ